MTDLDIIDAEVVITASEVRESIDRAKAGALTFWREVQWQVENEAWTKLGYETLDQFWDAEYMALNVGISRSDRPELVASFVKAGQKQADIAQKLNVGIATVKRDVAALKVSNDTFTGSTQTNSRGQERPATYRKPATTLRDAGVVDMATGEIYDPEAVTPENRAEVQAERERMLGLFTDAQTFTGALNRLHALHSPRTVAHYLEIHRIAQSRPDFATQHHNPTSIRQIAQYLNDYATALEEQS